ncbi:hypothetical protein ACJX0J_030022 [Zea mays]
MLNIGYLLMHLIKEYERDMRCLGQKGFLVVIRWNSNFYLSTAATVENFDFKSIQIFIEDLALRVLAIMANTRPFIGWLPFRTIGTATSSTKSSQIEGVTHFSILSFIIYKFIYHIIKK